MYVALLKYFVESEKSQYKIWLMKTRSYLMAHSLSLFLPSLCTRAVSCATVSLRTGEQALQTDSPVGTGPSWLMLYRLFPRLYCGRRLDVSLRTQSHRCLSPCWERCLCGSVRAAARVWKRRREGALRSNQIRWLNTNLFAISVWAPSFLLVQCCFSI